jgi:predicted DNA-binding protein with PD1-like motif
VFSTEISVARQFAVVLQPGDDVLGCIAAVCAEQAIEQGYFPVFLGAFSRVSLIGTCGPVEDPDAPLREAVHLGNVEGTGSGTIAGGPSGVLAHVHVAVGLKSYSATGYAGHLLQATVQYVTEIVIVEVVSPRFERIPDPAAHNIANLAFTAR